MRDRGPLVGREVLTLLNEHARFVCALFVVMFPPASAVWAGLNTHANNVQTSSAERLKWERRESSPRPVIVSYPTVCNCVVCAHTFAAEWAGPETVCAHTGVVRRCAHMRPAILVCVCGARVKERCVIMTGSRVSVSIPPASVAPVPGCDSRAQLLRRRVSGTNFAECQPVASATLVWSERGNAPFVFAPGDGPGGLGRAPGRRRGARTRVSCLARWRRSARPARPWSSATPPYCGTSS